MRGDDKVRLRATITYTLEYDARAEDYVQDGGDITAEEMAEMDAGMLRDGEFTLWDRSDAEESNVAVTVALPSFRRPSEDETDGA